MVYIPVPLTLPTGVVRSGTRFAVNGRYYDTNMVRFHKGKPQRWGGWEKFVVDGLTQPARGVLAWRANDGSRYLAFGTADKLWLYKDGTRYDITPSGLVAGDVDGTASLAYGEYGYGEGTYGGYEDPSSGVSVQASTWSLAKWGEDLLAVRRGSTLYQWSKAGGTGVVAQPVAGAPSQCLGVFVTPERFAVVYGAHDGTSPKALRLQWSSQETLTTWTPSATNSAGDIEISDGNEIRASIEVLDGHVLLTDLSAHTFKYIGGDFLYEPNRLAGDNGIIGPNAGIGYNGDAYWMSPTHFARYNGRVEDIDCDVLDYVFRDINRGQLYKVFAGTNKEFSEIIWLYPSNESLECNRYVTYQPKTGDWAIGNLDRTCWLDANILSSVPLATTAAGVVYAHEVGTLGDGASISYLLESGDVSITPQGTISAASNHLAIRKVVPDYERLSDGTHTLTVVRRDYPQADATEKGPYEFNSATRAYYPRARGATMAFRLEGDADFRMGQVTGFVTQGGGR